MDGNVAGTAGADPDPELTDNSVPPPKTGQGGDDGQLAEGGQTTDEGKSGEAGAADGPIVPPDADGNDGRSSGADANQVFTELARLGFKHDYKTVADMAKSHVELRRRLSERDALSHLGEQVLPILPQIQDLLKSQDKQTAPPIWNPPPIPAGYQDELLKPEAQRDPTVMAGAAKHFQYRQERWGKWGADPLSMVEELVMPVVEKRIASALQQKDKENRLEAYFDANREFLEQNVDRVIELIREGVPAQRAIEFAQMELKAKADSRQAKTSNAKERDLQGAAASKDVPTPRASRLQGDFPRDPMEIARRVSQQLGVAFDDGIDV